MGEIHQNETGVDGFIAAISRHANRAAVEQQSTAAFILRIGEEYAFIRLDDLWNPIRFLRQMAGAPPVEFGVQGFEPSLVDDDNPARHYIAFVWMGFWLPYPMALAVLWLWEIAGFIRYRGRWSRSDLRNGQVGIRHGQLARRYGSTILPGLIARDLAQGRSSRDAK